MSESTRERQSSIELALSKLNSAVESFARASTENASTLRASTQIEIQKARDGFEMEIRAAREAMAIEYQSWERTRRKALLWGPVTMLAVVLASAVLTVALTRWNVSRGTSQALSQLNQMEAAKIASLQADATTIQNEISLAKKTLSLLQAQNVHYLMMDRVNLIEDNGEVWAEISEENPSVAHERTSHKPFVKIVNKPSSP